MIPILLFLLSVNLLIPAALSCADTEILKQCPSTCPSDFCPTSDGQSQTCSQPNPCPPPACKCRFNYRRVSSQNATCIPTRECPPFACPKPNEAYDSCPPYCPTDSCRQATPTGRCPFPGHIGVILECRPACRCKRGYWRLTNGTCVPYSQCPGV